MENTTQVRELFQIGKIYNVAYTRFPCEVVICQGKLKKIDDYPGGLVHFEFVNGSHKGENFMMTMADFFSLNYSRTPIITAEE